MASTLSAGRTAPAVPSLSGRISTSGLICLAAGLLGAASGLFLLFVPAAVPEERFSYPLDIVAFVAIQLWFVVQHVGLLAGHYGLWLAGSTGRGRGSMWGQAIAAAGMLLLTLTEAVAITAAEALIPSGRTDLLDALYGTASIAIGLGFIIAGIAAARSATWHGWRKWLPLALGVYVFVPMTPAIIAGFTAARIGISGWMLLYAALGWGLFTEPRRVRI